MSAEIQFDPGPALTGITAYAILRNATGQPYNTAGAAFEAYNAANVADYDIALTEQGASGYFVGDMPVVTRGAYTLTVKQRAGATPAVSDTRIGGGDLHWSGTLVVWLGTAELAAVDETAGRPSRTLGKLQRVFEWAENERTRDRDTGIVTLKNAAGDGTLSTQTQGTAGDVDTQTQGA